MCGSFPYDTGRRLQLTRSSLHPQYIASELFLSLPPDLRTLSYSAVQNDTMLAEAYATPLDSATLESIVCHIPASITESLLAYNVIEFSDSLPRFLMPILDSYITSITSPPPIWTSTRASACEICERNWISLTYHHLIPRSTHAKVLKRGWHEEWELNKVAWICGACHRFVHSIESNEELAKHWHTVELLRDREDVQKWAAWIGKVRWKSR